MIDAQDVHLSSTPDQILIRLRSYHDFRSRICILNQEGSVSGLLNGR